MRYLLLSALFLSCAAATLPHDRPADFSLSVTRSEMTPTINWRVDGAKWHFEGRGQSFDVAVEHDEIDRLYGLVRDVKLQQYRSRARGGQVYDGSTTSVGLTAGGQTYHVSFGSHDEVVSGDLPALQRFLEAAQALADGARSRHK